VPVLRTVVLGLTALGLVVASLGIGQTAQSEAAARHLGFGYPLHFAWSDFTSYYTPPSYPQTYNLNPWEIPVGGNLLTFLVSWLATYGALLACWLLLRNSVSHALGRTSAVRSALTRSRKPRR
jgi:hypothetical protein